MTRERAKELLPLIKAYGEGKIVQVKDGVEWRDVDFPLFDVPSTYRIKPSDDDDIFMMPAQAMEFCARNATRILVRLDRNLWHFASYFDFAHISEVAMPRFEFTQLDDPQRMPMKFLRKYMNIFVSTHDSANV